MVLHGKYEVSRPKGSKISDNYFCCFEAKIASSSFSFCLLASPLLPAELLRAVLLRAVIVTHNPSSPCRVFRFACQTRRLLFLLILTRRNHYLDSFIVLDTKVLSILKEALLREIMRGSLQGDRNSVSVFLGFLLLKNWKGQFA